MRTKPHKLGYRIVVFTCIFLQINPPLLLAADPKKPDPANAAPAPRPEPTDEVIARLIAAQLGSSDVVGNPPALRSFDLTRDLQVARNTENQLDADVLNYLGNWLNKQPEKTLDVPAALLAADPKIQEKVQAGFLRMRAHYKEQFAAVDNYLAQDPDPIAYAERRLLELIKHSRQFREAKIREIDAKRMAYEAARRRTGISPEISEALLASRAEMTVLEEAMHRHNTKLFAGLTEYYRDETMLRRENRPPQKILAIWLEDTKRAIAESNKKTEAMTMAVRDVQAMINMWSMAGYNRGNVEVPKVIATPVGTYLVETALKEKRNAVARLELKMAAVEKHLGKPAPPSGPKGLTEKSAPEVLLGDIQALLHSTQDLKAKTDHYLYYRFSRGQMVVPPADEQHADTKRVSQAWLTALGWYRRDLEEKAREAGKKPAEFRAPYARSTEVLGLLGVERPEAEKTWMEKQADADRARRRITRPLKWAAAAAVVVGLAAGGKMILPHAGIQLPLEAPFSLPWGQGNGGNSPYFPEEPHAGQNFSLGTEAAEGEETAVRPKYQLVPGTESRLEFLPTEFEFAYLNERKGTLSEYRFTPKEGEAPVFSLVAEQAVRARDGWIAVAKTGRFDNQVEIKANGKVLTRGTDYTLYVAPSGTLLAKLNSAHANASLLVSNGYYRQTTAPNPIPARELELNAGELRQLLTQADFMEAEGLTVWAKRLRERVAEARNGKPLPVTELASLLAEGTFYPEKGSGKVQTMGTNPNPWSMLRDLPREEGKLVGQCSVSKDSLQKLIELAAPRFMPWITSVHVETRDAGSTKVGKAFGHTYLVIKPLGFDAIKMDATSGDLHPKYRMPQGEGLGEFSMPWHSLGTGSAVLAVLAAGWYLRKKLRRLTPEEERAAEAERGEVLSFKGERKPASIQAPKPPTPEEMALKELRLRNEQRRALATKLGHISDRAIMYAESLGADPGRRDRTLPFPTTAAVALLLREYALGQTVHDTEEKLVDELGRLFHFSAEEKALAGTKLNNVLTFGNRLVRKTRDHYLQRFPDRTDSVELNESLMKELEATFRFMRSESWTPYEREPLPTGVSCPLTDLARGKSA